MDAQTLPDGTQLMPAKRRGGQACEASFNNWIANEGQRLLDRREEIPTERIASSESFIWRSLLAHNKGGREIKTNGLSGRRRRCFQWDSGSNSREESEIEVYDQNGFHIGTMDPLKGRMTEGSRVEGREITVEVEDDDNTAFV